MNAIIGTLILLTWLYLVVCITKLIDNLSKDLPIEGFYRPGICLLKLLVAIGSILLSWWIVCALGDFVLEMARSL